MGAQGRAWHSEHFVCTVCDGDLSQVCEISKFVFIILSLFLFL